MKQSNTVKNSNIFFWVSFISHEVTVEPQSRASHLLHAGFGFSFSSSCGFLNILQAEESYQKQICQGTSLVVQWLREGIKVVLPIFWGKIISYVENYDPANSAALHEAYGYAAGLSACVLVWSVLHHVYFYHIQRVGMRLRVAVCRMIYRKSLRLSSSAMGKTTTGQIVNLLSNDVNRFDQVTMFLHYLWVGPLQAVAVTALLWMEIGMSCLAGMAVLIILLLLQSCVGNLFSSLRSKTAALTDDRIRTMSEIITGIRTVKMNAWEKSFIDLITRLRRKEISKILKSSYLRGLNLTSFFAVSKIMIFVTFITNELLDNLITGSQVFVVVMLFEALRFSSTLYFPMAIEKVSEAVVSIRRIKNFLLLDEIPQLYLQLPSDGERTVDVQNFTAFWDEESETPTLQGLSFTVRPGELLAVVGPVGAGKSSLLRALLGELPPSQGKVSVHGRIAYVSQQPWVFRGTVRSNILFGKKDEQDRFEKVIRACALEEVMTLDNGTRCHINQRMAGLLLLDSRVQPFSARASRLAHISISATYSHNLHLKVTGLARRFLPETVLKQDTLFNLCSSFLISFLFFLIIFGMIYISTNFKLSY
ncbi:hypothetical protein FD754_022951, partial [Muntiacus muntjak]